MDIERDDEHRLWSRARSGDGEALGTLLDLHGDRVYWHALRLVEQHHDAQDVVATAFFELWRKRSSVRTVDGSVLPWLLVTSTNICRNLNRSTRRYRAVLDVLPHAQPVPSAAEQWEATDAQLADQLDTDLAHELRNLPPKTASLLVLTALEGYSTSDAARAVGLSHGAARTRLSRAKASLRERLAHAPVATTTKEAHHD